MVLALQAPGPIFFRVGPPGKLQAASPQALKLDRVQAVGYYKIKNERKKC